MGFRFKQCALITSAFCLPQFWIFCWRTIKGFSSTPITPFWLSNMVNLLNKSCTTFLPICYCELTLLLNWKSYSQYNDIRISSPKIQIMLKSTDRCNYLLILLLKYIITSCPIGMLSVSTDKIISTSISLSPKVLIHTLNIKSY